MLKYSEVVLNILEFPYVKEIVESWLVYLNKFSWIIQSCFLTETMKQTKLVSVSFSFFSEIFLETNKFQRKKRHSYNSYNLSTL